MTSVALRTQPGNVIDQASMNVGFEIDGIDTIYQQDWSVLVRGTMHHVDVDTADFRARFDSEPWIGALTTLRHGELRYVCDTDVIA